MKKSPVFRRSPIHTRSKCKQFDLSETQHFELPLYNTQSQTKTSEETEMASGNGPEEQVVVHNKIPSFSVPKFGGRPHEDVKRFLDSYETASGIYKWSDSEKKQYLMAYLYACARDWYEIHATEIQELPTFSAVADKLKSAFRAATHVGDPYELLSQRRKLPTESYTEYLYSVLRLCNKVSPSMSEDDQMRNVMKGLPPDALEYLITKDCKTLEGVKDQLKLFETAKYQAGIRAMSSEAVNRKNNSPPVYNSKPRTFQGKRTQSVNDLIHHIQQLGVNQKPNACFYCKEIGHFIADCPIKRRKEEKGEKGNFRKPFPRRASGKPRETQRAPIPPRFTPAKMNNTVEKGQQEKPRNPPRTGTNKRTTNVTRRQ